MEFKDFLLIENKNLFAERLGDIITALENLADDPKNLEKKQKATTIANQIRKSFLRGNKWPKMDGEIETMITVAYNLLKSSNPKEESRIDLDDIIKSSIQTLKSLQGNLQVPVNQLASPEK